MIPASGERLPIWTSKLALQGLYIVFATLLRRRIKLVVAYCVKCKAKREMKNPQKVTMKNGKKATQGVCPVCGTKIFRIGG